MKFHEACWKKATSWCCRAFKSHGRMAFKSYTIIQHDSDRVRENAAQRKWGFSSGILFTSANTCLSGRKRKTSSILPFVFTKKRAKKSRFRRTRSAWNFAVLMWIRWMESSARKRTQRISTLVRSNTCEYAAFAAPLATTSVCKTIWRASGFLFQHNFFVLFRRIIQVSQLLFQFLLTIREHVVSFCDWWNLKMWNRSL